MIRVGLAAAVEYSTESAKKDQDEENQSGDSGRTLGARLTPEAAVGQGRIRSAAMRTHIGEDIHWLPTAGAWDRLRHSSIIGLWAQLCTVGVAIADRGAPNSDGALAFFDLALLGFPAGLFEGLGEELEPFAERVARLDG